MLSRPMVLGKDEVSFLANQIFNSTLTDIVKQKSFQASNLIFGCFGKDRKPFWVFSNQNDTRDMVFAW